jgi:hypothetical protein
MGVAKTRNSPVSFAAPGYGEGPVRYSNYAQQQWLRPSGGYASEEPGMVATTARRTVATSEGGGHPSRHSRPERRWFFKGDYIT